MNIKKERPIYYATEYLSIAAREIYKDINDVIEDYAIDSPSVNIMEFAEDICEKLADLNYKKG